MTGLDAKYANLTAAQAQNMIKMTEDVLAENPDAEWAKAHIAALNAILRVRNGESTSEPTTDDDNVTVGRPAGSAAGNQYGTFSVHAASQAQVRFLAKLIDTKVTDGVTLPSTLEGISKKSASALIDKLIDRPAKAGAPVKLASEKQINFLRKLINEKDLDAMVHNFRGDSLECRADWDRVVSSFTPSEASKAISALLSYPRKPIEIKVTAELDSGIYLHDGQVFKVYTNQARTRMLAKSLSLPQGWAEMTREQREASDEQPEWIYQGMADRFVKASEKMTLEQAQEFGTIYGVCSNCGRLLTDETSIEAGMGPVCRSKFA